MFVTHAGGSTIPRSATRTAELPRARLSKIFPAIGSARNAAWVKTIFRPSNKRPEAFRFYVIEGRAAVS
jgi:hypothetical protein